MRLIANCQLSGDYGVVLPGQEFAAPEDYAKELIAKGSARPAHTIKILYETKPARFEAPLLAPEAPEVSARPPFRDVRLSDAKSPRVAAEGDPMLPGSNVSKQGAIDTRGRRSR